MTDLSLFDKPQEEPHEFHRPQEDRTPAPVHVEITAAKLHRVFGPPGTGKTTYLSRQCAIAADKFGPENVVVGSLTKAAAAEVAGRDTGLPPANVGTLHSHAYHALKRPAIAETTAGLKAWNEYCGSPSYKISTRHAVDPENASPEMGMPSEDGSILLGEIGILRQRMVPSVEWEPRLQKFWQKWCEWKEASGYVDFTELIEKALTDTDELPQKPKVFMLDEAQDMSMLEFALAMHWGNACEQVVIVGDQDQNLYQWRGSDPAAFVEHEASSVHTLSQSYRVPSAVHAAAVRWIEQVVDREPVSYEPRRNEGSVVEGCLRREQHQFRDPVSLLRSVNDDLARGRSVMVLASCGYMLGPFIHECRKYGVPFHNPYRVKAGNWNPLRGARRLLSFVRNQPQPVGEGTTWTWGDVWSWVEPLQAKEIILRGKKGWIENKTVKDRFKASAANKEADFMEVLNCFHKGENDENWEAILNGDINWWESHLRHEDRKRAAYALTVARRTGFDALRETPRLCVGTIHSVKGGEADVVYLLPDLSSAAFYGDWRPGGDGRSGIIRMFYVGMTRAREELVLCSASSAEAVRWL